MEKLETTKEFVMSAHQAACKDLKQRIEEEFPYLFEVNLELNKWYFYEENTEIFLFQRIKENSDLVFGYFNGTWFDKDEDTWYWGDKTKVRLATETEVEQMLWKEAEKRGIGKDTKLESITHQNYEVFINQGIYKVGYFDYEDLLANKNGVVYYKGKWAKPLDPNKEIKETISRLEKELAELKEKVK